jgi:hypothetical protein
MLATPTAASVAVSVVASAVPVVSPAVSHVSTVSPSLPLQAGGRFDSLAQVGLLGYELVGALLGLFVAYQAYRGYRRNDSRPMFFIAAGFVLIVGLPVLLLVPYLLIPSLPQVAVQATTQTFEIAGLACIIYALRADPGE